MQVQQHSFGWTVSFYAQDGHVRHVTTVDSQMQALRSARNLVRAYHLPSLVLMISNKGKIPVDVNKLMH